MSRIMIFGREVNFPKQKRGPEGYPVYQEQAQNQRGINVPVSGVTNFPGGQGTSVLGDLVKERYNGKALPALVAHAKKLYKQRLIADGIITVSAQELLELVRCGACGEMSTLTKTGSSCCES